MSTPEAARKMIERLPATVWKVGVFVDEEPGAVAERSRAKPAWISCSCTAAKRPDDFPRRRAGVEGGSHRRRSFDPATLDQYPAEAVLLDGPANGVTFDWTRGGGASSER